ncbi:hypothetical protein KBY82_13630 [Cyanobium sp. AMD-g]|uniref:hypothetical protein n=1 Tax=Cyanobium sp. AMD-g TaxID=2823699 RepID=UPI0020CC1707|nr:hypothetical protein [Cyanobium sp. AMD-g]MCP9931820.1 hypothetical protein [Cyanobium sp. AMD-g]
MATPLHIPEMLHVNHFVESEGGGWDSEAAPLLDPRAIEPRMVVASPGSESGWGFHGRAERLDGRLGGDGLTLQPRGAHRVKPSPTALVCP